MQTHDIGLVCVHSMMLKHSQLAGVVGSALSMLPCHHKPGAVHLLPAQVHVASSVPAACRPAPCPPPQSPSSRPVLPHSPFEWCEAHGGVYALTILHGCYAAAIACGLATSIFTAVVCGCGLTCSTRSSEKAGRWSSKDRGCTQGAYQFTGNLVHTRELGRPHTYGHTCG